MKKLDQVKEFYRNLDPADKERAKKRGIIGGIIAVVLAILAVYAVGNTAGLFVGLLSLVVVALSMLDVVISDQTEDTPVANANGMFYTKTDGTPATPAEITAHLADPTANPLTAIPVEAGNPMPETLASSRLQSYFPGHIFEHVKGGILLLVGAVAVLALMYRGGDVPPTRVQEWLDSMAGRVQTVKTTVDTAVPKLNNPAPATTAPEMTPDILAKVQRISDTQVALPKVSNMRWVLIHEGKAKYVEAGRPGVEEKGDNLHLTSTTSLTGARIYVANSTGQASETVPLPATK